MKNDEWKYLLSYVVFLCFEITIIYFLWPETSGRTLEELAFLFEDKDMADQAAAATDKQLHSEVDRTGEKNEAGVVTIENKSA